jgi:hypothetical protein
MCFLSSSDFLKNIMETVESSKVPRQEEGSKAIRRFRITGLSSRINDFDLKDLFSNYGTIGRIDSKITLAYVQVKNGGIEQGNCSWISTQ